MTTYYKFLTAAHREPYSGVDYAPYLPTDGRPGRWLPTLSGDHRALVASQVGYHATHSEHLMEWIDAKLYEVQLGATIAEVGNKVLGTRLRLTRAINAWGERITRLFAADCAEHVLHVFEAACPSDDRPRRAIKTARSRAGDRGPVSRNAVEAGAAVDAASHAAGTPWADRDLASVHAAVAALCADGCYFGWEAAKATAGAAWHAKDAEVEERQWQRQRLMEYLKLAEARP